MTSQVWPRAQARPRSPRTTEEQDIAVDVFEFETPQTVMGVLQWLRKLDITRSKFGCQCIRIRDVKVSVPAGDAFFHVSLAVRQWSYANVFEQDLRTASANDAEEMSSGAGPWKVISNPSRSR